MRRSSLFLVAIVLYVVGQMTSGLSAHLRCPGAPAPCYLFIANTSFWPLTVGQTAWINGPPDSALQGPGFLGPWGSATYMVLTPNGAPVVTLRTLSFSATPFAGLGETRYGLVWPEGIRGC
jgi:hypothetical protein